MTGSLYERTGLLAVAPTALGALFAPPQRPERTNIGSVGLVEFHGPLEHHVSQTNPSYDEIKAKALARFESDARVVLMSGTSPGGDVGGMLDTAAELRAMRVRYNKPLHYYVDHQSSSACFALACAADRIWCPVTGLVGSIGAIFAMCDETALDRAMGKRWVIVRSGLHKATSNPHLGVTDEALEDLQRHVAYTSERFYEWVNARRGIALDSMREWAGKEFQGAEALALGLVDQIATFDEVVAILSASSDGTATAPTGGGQTTMSKRSEAIAALKAAAEEGDEDAKKDLEALGLAESEEKKPDEAKAAAKAEEEHKEPDGDEKKPEEAKATASASAGPVVDAGARAAVKRLENRMTVKELLAQRPDLPDDVRAKFSALEAPVLQGILEKLPVYPKATGPVAASRAAVGATPTPTGEAQPAVVSSGVFADVDSRYGLGAQAERPLVEFEGNRMYLNPGTPSLAAAHLATLDQSNKVTK